MTLRYDSRSRVSTYTQSWVSNADPDFGAYESIATTTVGAGGQTTITLSTTSSNFDSNNKGTSTITIFLSSDLYPSKS